MRLTLFKISRHWIRCFEGIDEVKEEINLQVKDWDNREKW